MPNLRKYYVFRLNNKGDLKFIDIRFGKSKKQIYRGITLKGTYHVLTLNQYQNLVKR